MGVCVGFLFGIVVWWLVLGKGVKLVGGLVSKFVKGIFVLDLVNWKL